MLSALTPAIGHIMRAAGNRVTHHTSDQPPADSLAAIPSGSPRGGRRFHWVRLAFLLGVLAFAAMFAFADLGEIWRVLSRADPLLLLLSMACACLSYVAMSRSYQGIATAAGVHVPFWEMFKITLVANTVNYLVATGGLSGFALRMYFFNLRAITTGTAVIISLTQTFLTNLTLLGFVLVGFLYLFSTHTLTGYALMITSVLLVLFLWAAVIAFLLLFHARWRRRTLFYLSQTAHWVLHRLIPHRTPPRTHIWRFQFNLNRGIQFLLARKQQMMGPFLYIVADWLFSILTLYAAFLAVHYPIRISFVVVGFAVGIIFSFVSLIPGGLGIMEGSMATIFAGFGVPFETAVVAVLIFRLAYYLLPLLISLFFHRMFVQGRQVSAELRAGELTPYP